jgi:hypothetical protein
MTIKDKYGIPPATWQALVRDGVITSRVSRSEDILSCYARKKESGLSHTEAVACTADEMRCSTTWVYEQVRNHSKV